MNDVDRTILEIEGQRWRFAGAKEQRVRDALHMSMARYTQRLDVILNDPDAYREQPSLIKRLRRLREQRAGERAAG